MQTNNERHPVDKLKISANGPLNGEIIVSGAKNAALPLMCAGLLTSGTLRLKNVPMLADVKTTQKLLQGMGARVLTDNISEFEINGGTVNNTCAPYELVKTMRASILVWARPLPASAKPKSACPAAAPSVRARLTNTSKASKPWVRKSPSNTVTSKPKVV